MTEPERSPDVVEYRRLTEQERKSARRRSWQRVVFWTLTVIVGVPVGGAVGLWLVLPPLGAVPSKRLRAECGENLRAIGVACRNYADQNEGVYPADLASLPLAQSSPGDAFLCPIVDQLLDHPTWRPKSRPSEWADTAGDYLYLGHGLRVGAPRDVIVARERLVSNHAPKYVGANVLFMDGRVEFLDETELRAAAGRSRMLRAKWESSRPLSPPTSRPGG